MIFSCYNKKTFSCWYYFCHQHIFPYNYLSYPYANKIYSSGTLSCNLLKYICSNVLSFYFIVSFIMVDILYIYFPFLLYFWMLPFLLFQTLQWLKWLILGAISRLSNNDRNLVKFFMIIEKYKKLRSIEVKCIWINNQCLI